jgi:hypothetical protein
MNIAIDFDGTVVTHKFPDIGIDIGAVPVLKKLIKNGHNLILFTMRSDVINPTSNDPIIIPIAGEYLTDAVNWFKKRDIPLWGINENPEQKSWTFSPKAYAHLYIDDAALGCPLTMGSSLSYRPFVDWDKVEKYLVSMNIIK